jgi:hypothetical protein
MVAEGPAWVSGDFGGRVAIVNSITVGVDR